MIISFTCFKKSTNSEIESEKGTHLKLNRSLVRSRFWCFDLIVTKLSLGLGLDFSPKFDRDRDRDHWSLIMRAVWRVESEHDRGIFALEDCTLTCRKWTDLDQSFVVEVGYKDQFVSSRFSSLRMLYSWLFFYFWIQSPTLVSDLLGHSSPRRAGHLVCKSLLLWLFWKLFWIFSHWKFFFLWGHFSFHPFPVAKSEILVYERLEIWDRSNFRYPDFFSYHDLWKLTLP